MRVNLDNFEQDDAPESAPAGRPRWLILVATFVILALGIGGVFLYSGLNRNGNQASAPTSSAAVTESVAVPTHTAEVDAVSRADCQPIGEGFVPVRYTLQNPSADEAVLSLGRDADNNIAAPPGDMPRTASWWNEGPTAGSQQGKVVLSVHTYRRGGALGNEMWDNTAEKALMQPGDLIKLYGANGEVACYEYTESMKVWVDEYDADSDIMVDYEGDPRLLIIICSDQVASEPSASRIFFYADPIEL